MIGSLLEHIILTGKVLGLLVGNLPEFYQNLLCLQNLSYSLKSCTVSPAPSLVKTSVLFFVLLHTEDLDSLLKKNDFLLEAWPLKMIGSDFT